MVILKINVLKEELETKSNLKMDLTVLNCFVK